MVERYHLSEGGVIPLAFGLWRVAHRLIGSFVEIELADWKMLFLYLTSKLAGRELNSPGGEMDVSKMQQLPAAESGPAGEELIQQLVSASGLPEAAVHQELSEICAVAGQDPGNMTLDQLRAAMLTYLEQLEASAQEADG